MSHNFRKRYYFKPPLYLFFYE